MGKEERDSTKTTEEGAQLDGWLRLMVTRVRAMLWATDRDFRITASAGAVDSFDLWGVPSREILGKRLDEVFGEGEQSAMVLAMHRKALEGEPASFVCLRNRRYFRCKVDAVSDGEGRTVGVVGVAIDETEREEERSRLAKAEWRFNAAQAIAHVGSYERDLDADQSIWSDEAYRILGLRPEEYDGTLAGFLTRCHPDDVDRVQQLYTLVMSRPGPVEADYRIIRSDGAVRVVHACMEKLGPGRRLVGVNQDITEQKAAEQRLKATVSLLEAALESTADGLLVVDLSAKHVIASNAKFAALWRIPAELLRAGENQPMIDFVWAQLADPETFIAKVRELYAHPERESHFEIRLKDGRIFEHYSQPQRVDGVPVGRVWSFRDVTDRHRAQAADERRHAAERAAREAAQAGAARAALLAEASRLLASLDHKAALASVANLVVRGFADGCAVDVLDQDGSVRRVAVAPDDADKRLIPRSRVETATRVAEEADHSLLGVPLAVTGSVLGAMRFFRARPRCFTGDDLALAEDLAGRTSLAIENARLFHRTEEALHARDEFLSLASHELRTPLATLQAATDALLAGAYGAVPPDSLLGRPLCSIGRQVRRLSGLASRILDAIALSTGSMDLHITQEDLSAIAMAVMARVVADAGTPPGEVTLSAPYSVVGHWDRARIEQVISSLVSNAINYGSGKPVVITVGRRGEHAFLNVQDHGAGIGPERLSTLFHRFERAGASRSLGGLGLGLYIDRGIVELHGGVIWVESQQGAGTTFFVELPLSGPLVPG